MSKKKIYILPGWGGSKRTWNEFVFLSKEQGLEAEIIELPCFGDEPCPTQVWGIEEYANFVREKLQQKKDIHLLGHSFGGQVATYIAANGLLDIKTLIISGAPIVRRPNTPKKIFIRASARLIKKTARLFGINGFVNLLKPFIYRLIDSPDYQRTKGIEREIFQKVTTQDLTGILNDITIPVNLVWGSNDSYVPVLQAKFIKTKIKDASLTIIPHGGHGLHTRVPKDLIHYILKLI